MKWAPLRYGSASVSFTRQSATRAQLPRRGKSSDTFGVLPPRLPGEMYLPEKLPPSSTCLFFVLFATHDNDRLHSFNPALQPVVFVVVIVAVYLLRGLVYPASVGIRKVRFRYPARPDALVFRNFRLRVDAGSTVALVSQLPQ